MPLANQPVYSPASGAPVASSWGVGVAEAVIQRFTTTTERDADWTNPPAGARCWVGPLTGTGGNRGMNFYYTSAWQPQGDVVRATPTADQTVSVDGTYQNVAYGTSSLNINSSWGGSGWTAPYAGTALFEASATWFIGNAAGGYDAPGDYNSTFIVNVVSGSQYNLDITYSRFQIFTHKGSIVLPVTASQQFNIQIKIANATGKGKTLKASPTNAAGLRISYV